MDVLASAPSVSPSVPAPHPARARNTPPMSLADPQVVETLVRARSRSKNGNLGRLTPRELEVLGAMATGTTNGAIANQLYLSKRAVEKHINSIFSKLCLTGDQHAHPRVRAVLLYLSEAAPVANDRTEPSLEYKRRERAAPRSRSCRSRLFRGIGHATRPAQ